MRDMDEAEAVAAAQGAALMLGAEMYERRELEHRLAAASRVAEEAMRMLTPEQLAELRHRLDALEAGES